MRRDFEEIRYIYTRSELALNPPLQLYLYYHTSTCTHVHNTIQLETIFQSSSEFIQFVTFALLLRQLVLELRRYEVSVVTRTRALSLGTTTPFRFEDGEGSGRLFTLLRIVGLCRIFVIGCISVRSFLH